MVTDAGAYRGYRIYFQVGIGYTSTVNGETITNLDLVELKRRIDQILDNPPIITPPQPPVVPQATFNGINYVGKWWSYNDVPLADLDLLQSLGVKWISLHIAWNIFEPIRGTFNDSFASNMVKIANAAHSKGMSVMLDNHYFGQGHYSSPSWTPTKQDFVDMIQALNKRIPHDALSMANESAGNIPIDWFEAAKPYAGYSTIRMDWPTFNTYADKTRLFNVLDFVSVNYYKQYFTVQQLQTIKTWSGYKPLWITEMGSLTTDDAQQYADYQSQKVLFQGIQPTVVMPWIWEDPLIGPATLAWNLKSAVAPGYRPAMIGSLP